MSDIIALTLEKLIPSIEQTFLILFEKKFMRNLMQPRPQNSMECGVYQSHIKKPKQLMPNNRAGLH